MTPSLILGFPNKKYRCSEQRHAGRLLACPAKGGLVPVLFGADAAPAARWVASLGRVQSRKGCVLLVF